ncbi:hypothetical protein ACTQZF_03465 [Collinsella sp. LCP19S3_H3]
MHPAGSIAPFVVSSPFHGLRVVPCKLTYTYGYDPAGMRDGTAVRYAHDVRWCGVAQRDLGDIDYLHMMPESHESLGHAVAAKLQEMLGQ